MKIQVAGIAMIRLNDIAAALSFNPTRLIWRIKNLITSYKGTPLKPGIKICLLLRAAKATGGRFNMKRSNFVTVQV